MRCCASSPERRQRCCLHLGHGLRKDSNVLDTAALSASRGSGYYNPSESARDPESGRTRTVEDQGHCYLRRYSKPRKFQGWCGSAILARMSTYMAIIFKGCRLPPARCRGAEPRDSLPTQAMPGMAMEESRFHLPDPQCCVGRSSLYQDLGKISTRLSSSGKTAKHVTSKHPISY